jgi:hypothetical protein
VEVCVWWGGGDGCQEALRRTRRAGHCSPEVCRAWVVLTHRHTLRQPPRLYVHTHAHTQNQPPRGHTRMRHALTRGALDRKLAPDEVGEFAVALHARRQRRHALAQRAVALVARKGVGVCARVWQVRGWVREAASERARACCCEDRTGREQCGRARAADCTPPQPPQRARSAPAGSSPCWSRPPCPARCRPQTRRACPARARVVRRGEVCVAGRQGSGQPLSQATAAAAAPPPPPPARPNSTCTHTLPHNACPTAAAAP